MEAFLARSFIIKGIKDPVLAARIISLGLYPGRTLHVWRKSPWGGAFYVSVDRCHFALREDEFQE
ncbi:MAG: ferrous iron transport protein A [Saprospiraceae bacterium]|nr:ferrous iron transport protein A [Saprospiraceae bacterium]